MRKLESISVRIPTGFTKFDVFLNVILKVFADFLGLRMFDVETMQWNR